MTIAAVSRGGCEEWGDVGEMLIMVHTGGAPHDYMHDLVFSTVFIVREVTVITHILQAGT